MIMVPTRQRESFRSNNSFWTHSLRAGFLVTLVIGLTWAQWAVSAPHVSRQWSRSTLLTDYVGFLTLNRMQPLLTDQYVVQGNSVDGIKAFNRKTGHEVWSLQLQNGVEGGAVVDENRLYFGSNNGYFYCLDIHSGQVLWKYRLNSESLTYPLVQGEFVYHVTGNNTLYSFNKKTGESIWVKTNAAKSNMTVRGQTSPIYENGRLYLGFSDGSFVSINALNGRELWSKRIGDDKKFNDVDATAVIAENCVLVASYANALYCLDKNNGNIQWRHDVGGYNSVLLDKDRIYYPTATQEIHILEASSGKFLKKIVGLKGLATELSSFGEYIVYGESNGALVIRQKNSLKIVKQFSPGLGLFARPTVDENKSEIYIMSNQANIFRLDIKQQPDNPFQWSQHKQ